MKKTVVIHQPDFIPYIGFFHRLLRADLFVILDDVQFVHSNQGWTHRDRIKTPQGGQWVTINVKKARRDTSINQIELSQDTDWKVKNLNLIRQNYRHALYFAEIYPYLERLYAYECTRLLDFNLKSIELLMDLLGIDVPTLFASTLGTKGNKNELMVDILSKVSATHYLSGVGAKAYFDAEPFRVAGIEVIWQDFSHPHYPQLHGKFIPYLSSIDLLFNCGIERSREILRSC
jgi:hypothetical protein